MVPITAVVRNYTGPGFISFLRVAAANSSHASCTCVSCVDTVAHHLPYAVKAPATLPALLAAAAAQVACVCLSGLWTCLVSCFVPLAHCVHGTLEKWLRDLTWSSALFLSWEGRPRGRGGERGASSMSCSSLHYHVCLQLCRLFFLYCRYESVMNLFVVIVHFRASRAILSSVDLVLRLCLFEV